MPLKYNILPWAMAIVGACGVALFLNYILNEPNHLVRTSDPSSSELKSESQTDEHCSNLCLSEECIHAASYALSKLDTRQKPCDGFNKFVCGKVLENQYFNDKDRRILEFESLGGIVMQKVKDMIEQAPDDLTSKKLKNLSHKRKSFYDSCRNPKTSDEIFRPSLLNYIAELGIEGWPNLPENFSFSEDDLEYLISRLMSIGSFSFLRMIFRIPEESQSNETSENVKPLLVEISTMGYPFLQLCPNLTDVENFKAYLRNLIDFLELTDEQINSLVEEIVETDRKFSEVTKVIKASRNFTRFESEKFSLNCFDGETKKKNRWCNILQHRLEFAGMVSNYTSANITFFRKEKVDSINDFLNSLSSRSLANYLVMRFLKHYVMYMRKMPGIKQKEMPSCAHRRSREKVVGIYENKWDSCALMVTNMLNDMVANGYTQAEVPHQTEIYIEELFDEFKMGFISTIQNIAWMGNDLKDFTSKKIESVIFRTKSWFDRVRNLHAIDVYYNELDFQDDNFFYNILKFNLFSENQYIRRPGGNFNSKGILGRFDGDALGGAGIVDVGLGFYIPPIVAHNRPKYLEYGFLGMILGHELSHTFQQLTENETVNTPEDTRKVLEFRKCLVDQYSQYAIPYTEAKIGGKRTFLENFADHFAVHIALRSYRKYVEIHGEEPRLPGISYTNEQMLVISMSQLFCEFGGRKDFEIYIDDPHSPSFARIDGTFKNIREFSEIFQCPLGSPMNPEKKCLFTE